MQYPVQLNGPRHRGEILEKPEIVYKDVNGVMKRFAVLRLEHFSTYAVILRGTFGSNPQQEQY